MIDQNKVPQPPRVDYTMLNLVRVPQSARPPRYETAEDRKAAVLLNYRRFRAANPEASHYRDYGGDGCLWELIPGRRRRRVCGWCVYEHFAELDHPEFWKLGRAPRPVRFLVVHDYDTRPGETRQRISRLLSDSPFAGDLEIATFTADHDWYYPDSTMGARLPACWPVFLCPIRSRKRNLETPRRRRL